MACLISKFNNSTKMMETHSAMCVQWSKFYRNIEMELSLETEHRGEVNEFVSKCRQEYDRLLDDSPDIPSNSIDAFNMTFPDKENKPMTVVKPGTQTRRFTHIDDTIQTCIEAWRKNKCLHWRCY